MSFQVFGSVLPLAVGGLMQILHDPGACRLRVFEVPVNIADEYRQALCVPRPACAGLQRPGRALLSIIQASPRPPGSP